MVSSAILMVRSSLGASDCESSKVASRSTKVPSASGFLVGQVVKMNFKVSVELISAALTSYSNLQSTFSDVIETC